MRSRTATDINITTTSMNDFTHLITSLGSNRVSILYAKKGFQNTISSISDDLLKSILYYTKLVHILGLIVVIVSSILIFVLISIATHSIVYTIKNLQNFAKGIFDKDLSIRLLITSKDELGLLASDLNKTVEGLDNVISQVKKVEKEAKDSSDLIHFSAGETASATTQISSNIQALDKQFDNLMNMVSDSSQALKQVSNIVKNLLTVNKNQSDTITDNSIEIAEMAVSVDSIKKMSTEKAQNAEEIRTLAENIRLVDIRTNNVNKQTSVIAKSAENINLQYKELNKKELSLSNQMNKMQNVFQNSISGLKEIDSGTANIVTKMYKYTLHFLN